MYILIFEICLTLQSFTGKPTSLQGHSSKVILCLEPNIPILILFEGLLFDYLGAPKQKFGPIFFANFSYNFAFSLVL